MGSCSHAATLVCLIVFVGAMRRVAQATRKPMRVVLACGLSAERGIWARCSLWHRRATTIARGGSASRTSISRRSAATSVAQGAACHVAGHRPCRPDYRKREPHRDVCDGVNDGNRYGGGFYWYGGGSPVTDTARDGLSALWDSYGVARLADPILRRPARLRSEPLQSRKAADHVRVGCARRRLRPRPRPMLPSELWAPAQWVRGDWPLARQRRLPVGRLLDRRPTLDGQLLATQIIPI